MVRKRDLSPRLGMAPDFVAAGTGTVELETKRSETAGNFPVGKSCEASHLRDRNRNAEFALRPNLAPEHPGWSPNSGHSSNSGREPEWPLPRLPRGALAASWEVPSQGIIAKIRELRGATKEEMRAGGAPLI